MDLKKYLQNHKKTHLIFDLDETIVWLIMPWNDWEKPIEDKLNKTDEKILKDYKNGKMNLSDTCNLYIKKYPQIKNLILKNWLEFEKQNLDQIKINNELVKIIKSLEGYELSIWSSNSKFTITSVLKKLEIFEKFKKIISHEDVTLIKPEAEGFNLIWDKKTPKSAYLFIGDSANDEQAAKDSGIDYFKEEFFK